MKIGILSDSHDNLPAIAKAVGLFNDIGVSLVIHAGDLVAPFVTIPLKNLKAEFVAVFGNNDGDRSGLSRVFPDRIHRPPHILSAAGKIVLVLHEPDNLDVLVNSRHFDAVVYGHTHKTDIRKGKTVVINPGECGGWLTGSRTVAVWDVESDEIQVFPV